MHHKKISIKVYKYVLKLIYIINVTCRHYIKKTKDKKKKKKKVSKTALYGLLEVQNHQGKTNFLFFYFGERWIGKKNN
jgi:hypothetical protein